MKMIHSWQMVSLLSGLLWSCCCIMVCVTFLIIPSVFVLADASSPSSPSPASLGSSSVTIDQWDIGQPIDEGLLLSMPRHSTTTTTEATNGDDDDYDTTRLLEPEELLLRKVLRQAELDSIRLFSKPPTPILPPDVMKPMTYGIFNGEGAAIRNLNEQDRHLILPQKLFPTGTAPVDNTARYYRVCAALLLLRGYSDAAHEVLLGVTPDNLKEAEYAATHRGQTNWAAEHPLSDSADQLHAAMHRIVEGNTLGEGNQSGYDNARYWLAGGPKLLPAISNHPVRQCLARIAKQHTPLCVVAAGKGVIAQDDNVQYVIPAGGGKTRTVRIPRGQWDDYAFLELCKRWADGLLNKDSNDDLAKEIVTLQRAELILLLRYELLECLGQQQ